MKTLALSFLFFALFDKIITYCPPLVAPKTTELTCEDPVKQQKVNCSASWLAEGTVAYFSCRKDVKKRAKGKIHCFEDGIRLRMPDDDSENSSEDSLPCGIKRDTQKSDIHIYGYQSPVNYDLTEGADLDYQHIGEALHNKFRRNHGSPPLQLSANLSKLAQDWADQVSTTGRLDMAPNLLLGQNVFLVPSIPSSSNSTAAVNDAVQNWYFTGRSEYCWADVTENWSNSQALVFSQLIWKDSKFLGIGAAPLKSGRKGTVVIAFYDPSGNKVIEGDERSSETLFELNVLPLQVNYTL